MAFPLRSLPALPEEILERFSSSSLPPSFALGRFAAVLFTGRIAASPLAAGDNTFRQQVYKVEPSSDNDQPG